MSSRICSMARVNTKFANGSDAIVPGSYELVSCKITCNDGQVFDIRELIAKFTIDESIHSASIAATFNILDANAYLEKLKISGNERLDLRIARRDINGERYTIDKELYISKIGMYAKTSPGNSTYVITALSKQAYLNSLLTVSEAFSGSVGVLVEKLCKDKLQIDPFLINKDTKDIIKGVYPRMRPLALIHWLLRRAYDNETPYYFYESLCHGVTLDSYENMANADVYETYNHTPFSDTIIGSIDNYEQQRTRVIHLSTDKMDISQYSSAQKGAYSSTLHTIDIANKTYKKSKYTYSSKKIGKLNNNQPFSSNITFNDRALDSYTEAKNHYISLNSKAFGNISNYNTPADNSICMANAYRENLNAFILDIRINGDLEIASGKKVHLAVRKGVNVSESDESTLDKFLSGDYLVDSIRHSFDTEYTQTLTLKRDSYIESLDQLQIGGA